MVETTFSQGTSTKGGNPYLSLPILEPGEQVAGQYEILERLGKGGMAIVYRARPLRQGLPEEVALKAVAVPDGRFLREARLGAVIRHPNVCEILDYGQDRRGFGYLVMPLLRGETLEAYLAQGQKPFAELLPYFIQILGALEAASSAGIVHRDIKPANIVLDTSTGKPIVKVVDFGLSKWRTPEDASTASDEVFGTPFYMSPEQVRSTRETDMRADLWSVGVMLYEAVTGSKPFQGATAHEVFTAILSKQPTRPSMVNPAVPRGLEEVILRAMESDREDRFSSPAQMRAALKNPTIHKVGLTLTPQILLGVSPRSANPTRGERLMKHLHKLEPRLGSAAHPNRRLWHGLAVLAAIAGAVATLAGAPGVVLGKLSWPEALLALPVAFAALCLGVVSFVLYVRRSSREALKGRRPGIAAAEAISIVSSPYLWLAAVAFGLADSIALTKTPPSSLALAAQWTGVGAYAWSAALHAWLAARSGGPRPPWPQPNKTPVASTAMTILFFSLIVICFALNMGALFELSQNSPDRLVVSDWTRLYTQAAFSALLAWGLQVVGVIAAFVLAYGRRAATSLGVDPACGPAGIAAALSFTELLEDEQRIADGLAGFLLLCAVTSGRPALVPLGLLAVPGVHLFLAISHRTRQKEWLKNGQGGAILDEWQKPLFLARALNSLPLILLSMVSRREMILVVLYVAVAGMFFL